MLYKIYKIMHLYKERKQREMSEKQFPKICIKGHKGTENPNTHARPDRPLKLLLSDKHHLKLLTVRDKKKKKTSSTFTSDLKKKKNAQVSMSIPPL